MANIVNAMKSGNSTEVAKYFDETVEITFSDKSSSYPRKQAERILNDFFTANPPKRKRRLPILHRKTRNQKRHFSYYNLYKTVWPKTINTGTAIWPINH